MPLDLEPIVAGAIVVVGQVAAYIKSQAKAKAVANNAAKSVVEDSHVNTDKVVRRLNEQAQQIENISERMKSLSIAFSAVDTSIKNTQYVINNVSEKVDKQGRLLVEFAKAYKLSDKTVVKGE